MAHIAQMNFVKIIANSLLISQTGKTLEIGSLDINGGIRGLFNQELYVGLDIAFGPNVDIVCEGQNYDEADNTYDQVISCEAMEHNPYWKETFLNMVRLCKPDGVVVITCATTGRLEHGTSRTDPEASPLTVGKRWNYYKNLTSRDFINSIDMKEYFSDFNFWSNWSAFDLYFIGIKSNSTENKNICRNFDNVLEQVNKFIAAENSRKFCKYRYIVAQKFGEPGFKFMRRVTDYLDKAHYNR
jgi:SAM-dependent methyltransferase